jgi:hypothetical protein
VILSDREITDLIDSGELTFNPPLDKEQLKGSAIDLRLGYNFSAYPKEEAHIRKAWPCCASDSPFCKTGMVRTVNSGNRKQWPFHVPSLSQNETLSINFGASRTAGPSIGQ